TSTPKPTATHTATATPTPTATATATATPTATPTPTSTPAATAAPASGNPSALESKGHGELVAGNYSAAIDTLQAAVRQCGGSGAVDPCAYAMYDLADAYLRAGRPQD